MANYIFNPLPEHIEKVVDQLNDLTRSNKTLSPTFLSYWLNEFKSIENSVKYSKNNQPKVNQVIVCFNAYSCFMKFHAYNEQCKTLYMDKPIPEDESEVLKWLVKVEPIHEVLWLEQVEFMDNWKIDEDKSIALFQLVFGEQENITTEDGLMLEKGQFIKKDEYNFAVELHSVYYTIKLLDETWDLYDEKLEKYSIMDQSVIELYSESDEIYQNRFSLTYHLQKRGLI
jgi:hypothetical protein